MSEIKTLTDKLVAFRDARDWAQFHNSKDLAIAISAEAGELLEIFLWKDPIDANRDKIKEELADILAFCFLLAHKEGLDISQIIEAKVRMNEKKYPVEKSKGNAKKYNEL
jgi:NTP pyrophosphatase (non-canonical NTP hydrolase)